MWSDTKKVCITSALSRLLEADDADLVAWAKTEIAKRQSDERYSVTVRHIGDKDRPFRYDEIVAREDSERVIARARAASRLREAGAEPTKELLEEYSRSDPLWRKVLGEQCRTWIVEGVVGGESEYHRLYALGFEDGGAQAASSLLVHAALEVRRFQEVPSSTLKSD